MGSSPGPFGIEAPESFLSIFNNMRNDAAGQSLQSSPMRPNESSTSYFDDATASPFNDRPAPSKTPISRMKTAGGGHAFLTSPMNPFPPSLGSSLQASLLKQSAGSPLTYRRSESNEDVQVADPMEEPSWSHDGMDGSDQDLGSVFVSDPFSSPVQKRTSHSVTSTPPPPSTQRSHMTPTSHTPRAPTGNASAPSTLTRHHRSLSGLGTPSMVRSPLRPRQVTDDPSSMPPSPSLSRRRHNSGSLTTRAPLARAVSHGSFPPPFFPQQDRNVSGASSRTVSTSYELHSPRFGPMTEGYESQQLGHHTVPELVGSRSLPSPQVSQGHSPLCTPTQAYEVYYQSPDMHQASLMSGVNQVMGPGSVPNSVSMSSVASFSGNHGYRQSTLGTISETPVLMQEESIQAADDMMAPGSYHITQGPIFHNAEYPSVPGMRQSFSGALPSAAHPANIHAWAAQTIPVNTNIGAHQTYGATGPIPHSHFQRHASGPFYNGQPSVPSHMLAPPVTRSFSAPHMEISSSMSSMSGMPMSHETGGLFGPGSGSELLADGGVMLGGPQMGHYGTIGQGGPSVPSSALTSPNTPRKRHPSVGTRLKPGPKPKTPKKTRSSSNPVSSPVALPAGELIKFGGALGGTVLGKIDEGKDDNARAGSAQSKGLDFGPDLAAFAVQRPPSAPPVAPVQSATQPQLFIQPPRLTGENAASGLPRSFLEKLYTTYIDPTGGTNGLPVKRFKCLIEGCERTFPRKSAIHSHIQTHLEDKPFQCDAEDCGAAFVRQHDLRRHMRIHSGNKPFNCPCGKGFARGDALHRHRQRGICQGSIVPQRTDRSPPRYDPYARPPGHQIAHAVRTGHHMQHQQMGAYMMQ